MQIVSRCDNLQEMSNLIFWKKKKITSLSSAILAQRVVKLNFHENILLNEY